MTTLLPMLATLAPAPFTKEGWRFEVKWDGFRTLAHIEGPSVRLFSRNGHDVTAEYPELAGLADRFELPTGLAVIDGEIIALDAEGMPSFQLLQHRQTSGLGRPALTFVAFDLLVLASRRIMEEPLAQRREKLRGLLATEGPEITLSRDLGADGEALFAVVCERGLEGIIAKRQDSAYLPGIRTKNWLKIKCRKEQDCVILGWAEGKLPLGFGALLAGVYDAGQLRYAGRVGSGPGFTG